MENYLTLLENKFVLSKDKHLITKSMTAALENRLNKSDPLIKDTFNVVCLRMFKRKVSNDNKDTLAYQYFSYPKIFAIPFIIYLRQRHMNDNPVSKRLGSFFPIIDVEFFANKAKPDTLYYESQFNLTEFLDDIKKGNGPALYNYLNKIKYICDVNKMTMIIRLILEYDMRGLLLLLLKDHFQRIVEISGADVDKIVTEIVDLIYEDIPNYSSLNNCVFIVKDLDILLDTLRKKGYDINAGPQSYRGHINSASLFLSLLDDNFRHCLMVNNDYHTKLSSNIDLHLSKKLFTFDNIHRVIGKARY